MVSADLLTRAAQTLRDRAEKATHADIGHVGWEEAARNWLGGPVGEFCALMSPGAALLLAAWLDQAARDWPGSRDQAVPIAREILREHL